MRSPRKSIAFKSFAGVFGLLVIFTIVMGAIGLGVFSDAILEQYSNGAFRTARSAALMVNADRMEEYLKSGGKTEEYMEVYTHLDRLCNSQDATFVYVIQPDTTDYEHITFVFSTMNRKSHYTHYELGYVRATTNDDYREKYKALYDQTTDTALVLRNTGYIETDPHITAMIPLIGSNGQTKAILCVQRQMDSLNQARHEYIQKLISALILLSVVLIAGVGIYLNRTLLRPVKKITDEASRFAKENTPAETKLQDKIHNVDEIGTLAGAIDQMEEQVHKYIKDLTHATAEKERISTELSLASKIQESMLPNTFPAFPDRKDFDIYASMTPAKEVGGDFYDFFLVDDDHLCIEIADVSGKGIPAALFMMAVTIILKHSVYNPLLELSPAKVLEVTNMAVCANNPQEMFVTVWLGILELSTGKLKAANAGHEYPALKQAGGEFELIKDKHGLVIGGMEDAHYTEYEMQLKPGAKLFLYTDGVPEATDCEANMFGTDHMIASLNEAPDTTLEELLQHVRKSVDTFVGGEEQFDDLTMLTLEYRGKKSSRAKRKSAPARAPKEDQKG